MKAIDQINRIPTQLEGCSRTDAGVHAYKQVCHVDIANDRLTDGWKLCKGINHFLHQDKQDIRVWDAIQVPNDWHCRSGITKKIYHYKIVGGAAQIPIFYPDTSFCVSRNRFDVDLMRSAARMLSGEQDYATFKNATRYDWEVPTVRDISINVNEHPPFAERSHLPLQHLQIEVEGKSFFYNMVRNLAGALMAVGCKKLTLDDLRKGLDAKERTKGRFVTAPPGGLYLFDVQYVDPSVMQMMKKYDSTEE
eukprot:TRINITY_DN4085_c0_g1_i1.p1 TRINITY_DN4085_c0_g1~~TRINITY_DN4085_c0_g1_i1.p1  ORF type:complete len:250 (+),score=26.90 TRINITY_DN4085_c0_g1_i1:356-1105(+)